MQSKGIGPESFGGEERKKKTNVDSLPAQSSKEEGGVWRQKRGQGRSVGGGGKISQWAGGREREVGKKGEKRKMG